MEICSLDTFTATILLCTFAQVITENGTRKHVRDIEVGDKLLSFVDGLLEYSTVHTILHREHKKTAQFLRFRTLSSTHIDVTPKHRLFVDRHCGGNTTETVFASEITVMIQKK